MSSDFLLDIPHPRTGELVNIDPITNLKKVDPEEGMNPRWGEAFTSGLILSNPISGAIDRGHLFRKSFEADPDYNVTEDPALKGEDLMLYAGSKSAEESQYKRQEIERNMIHRTLASYSGGGWGSFVGVLGDPTIMGTAIATGGSSLGVAAAADITAEVVRETILHSQQPLRTKTETAFNIATVAVVDATLYKLLGKAETRANTLAYRKKATDYMADPGHPIQTDFDPGLMGGNLTPLGRAEQFPQESVDDFIQDFTKAELQESAVEMGIPKSGNKATIAQRIKDKIAETVEEIEPPTPKGAGDELSEFGEDVVEGWVPGMSFSPAGNVLSRSISQTAKKMVQALVDVPYRFRKTEAGEAVPASVEAKVKKSFGDWADMADIFDEQFKAYRKAGGRLDEEDFLLRVHRQMETGVRGTDPHIDRVSDYFKKFDDQYFAKEQAAGVAGSRRRGGHVMRVFNQAKIHGDRVGLRNTIVKNMRRVLESGVEKALIRHVDGSVEFVNRRAVKAVLSENPESKVISVDGAHPAELEKIADDITNSMESIRLDDVEPDLIVLDPSSIKSRSLDFVPTRELEPWLETNALSIMGMRSRQHYRASAMREAFPEDPSMVKYIEKIRDEYQAAMEVAGADIKALGKQLETDLQVVKAMRDSVSGTYGIPDNPYSPLVRTGRFLRLGALTGFGANISSTSLTDMITPAIRSGLAPFREGINLLFKKAARKEYLAQIRRMGIAVEKLTNNKAAMLINMAYVTKGEQRFMKMYGKLSGLDWVTDTSQGMNAISHLSLWKKWGDKGFDTLAPAKQKRLLDVGIDGPMLTRIKSQWDEFGEVIDGERLPTTTRWADEEAAEALENAIRKETFMTTLVPGKGDIPLWLQTEPGKFFGMFQSFISGAHQRLLVSGFQRGDAAFYTGVLVSAIGGGLVQAGKDLARGKDMTQRDPIEYVVDSIDKTGLLGWFSIPMQAGSSMAAGRPAEFVYRNMSDTVFSPPPLEWASTFGVPLLGLTQGETPEQEEFMRLVKATPFLNTLHFMDMSERLYDYRTE